MFMMDTLHATFSIFIFFVAFFTLRRSPPLIHSYRALRAMAPIEHAAVNGECVFFLYFFLDSAAERV